MTAKQKQLLSCVIMDDQVIGFHKLHSKLLFVRYAVIASQRARWCGNPPDEWNQVTISTKNAIFSTL